MRYMKNCGLVQVYFPKPDLKMINKCLNNKFIIIGTFLFFNIFRYSLFYYFA